MDKRSMKSLIELGKLYESKITLTTEDHRCINITSIRQKFKRKK